MRFNHDGKNGIRLAKVTDESDVVARFLEFPDDDTYSTVFHVFSPQLVTFFRRRGHDQVLAEDLAQEVMLTVYRKAGQLRDRSLFRAWLFKIARNTVSRHFADLAREVSTVDLDDVGDRVADHARPSAGPSFEFRDWMAFLDPRERTVMTMRFVEGWEYHEIAAAQAIPIGTVQWRVFNSKKKLAVHLNRRPDFIGKAA